MSARQMPLYDPEDPRWDAWRRDQRRSEAEDAFYRAHYRYGERGVLTRYIIAPRGRLAFGLTVSDVLAALAVTAFLLLLVQAFGIGLDGYLDAAGY